MDEYLSEKEQLEELRQWWRENGRFVVTGLLIGLIAVFGWMQWTKYREAQLAAASGVFNSLLEAADAGTRDRALELATQLDTEYARTPYARQAALVLARMYVDADEPEQAAAELQKVTEYARDPELKEIAQLRLARVRLYQQKADEALRVLGETAPAKFAPLFYELRGDALAAMGRTDDARAAYEQALAALEPGLGDRSLLEMKLSDVAPLAAPAAPATSSDGGS